MQKCDFNNHNMECTMYKFKKKKRAVTDVAMWEGQCCILI